MVFGALIEYACVGYTDKRIQLRKNRWEKRYRWQLQYQRQWQLWHIDIDDNDYIKDIYNDYIITLMTITKQRESQWGHNDIDDDDYIKDNDNEDIMI